MLGLYRVSLVIQIDFNKLIYALGSGRASARDGQKRANEPLRCSSVGLAKSASECVIIFHRYRDNLSTTYKKHAGVSHYVTHIRTCGACIESHAILRPLTLSANQL